MMNSYQESALRPIEEGDNIEVELLLVDNGNMPSPRVIIGEYRNTQLEPLPNVRILRHGRITIIPWHAIAAIRPALTAHPSDQE